jgi:hypothetical protein
MSDFSKFLHKTQNQESNSIMKKDIGRPAKHGGETIASIATRNKVSTSKIAKESAKELPMAEGDRVAVLPRRFTRSALPRATCILI